MQNQKKKKLKFFLLMITSLILILFVIVSCIIVNYQRKTLDKINEDNNNLPEQEIVKIL